MLLPPQREHNDALWRCCFVPAPEPQLPGTSPASGRRGWEWGSSSVWAAAVQALWFVLIFTQTQEEMACVRGREHTLGPACVEEEARRAGRDQLLGWALWRMFTLASRTLCGQAKAGKHTALQSYGGDG